MQQQQQQHQRKSSSKIDPRQIPSPTSPMTWTGSMTEVVTRDSSPTELAAHPLSQYWVRDTGNCGPRFMRPTYRTMATTASGAKAATLPIAVVVRPFADPGPGEESVAVADCGADGPLRCLRCKAYANVWDRFVDGGRTYGCGLCGHQNEVPTDRYSPLDQYGRRHDSGSRPEYSRGSVDYLVGGDYVMKAKGPLSVVFALDASSQSVASGVVRMFVEQLSATLDSLSAESPLRIGIVTFNEAVHFYDLSAALQTPKVLVVPEPGVFLPIAASDRLVVSAKRSARVIKTLLASLPEMVGGGGKAPSGMSATCAGVRAGMLALKACGGGKLVLLQATLPNFGEGKLQPRVGGGGASSSASGSAAAKAAAALLSPASTHYPALGEQCAKQSVSVDVMAFAPSPSVYMDLASLGSLAEMTGGAVRHYVLGGGGRGSGEDVGAASRARFGADLHHAITQQRAYDAVMRMRVSTGLDVTDYLGNAYRHAGASSPDVSVAAVDNDATYVIGLKYDGDLADGDVAVLQCAVLHTRVDGQRAVRVHTLGVPVAQSLSRIFRMVDLSAAVYVNAATFSHHVKSGRMSPADARSGLQQRCIQTLTQYRKRCAQNQRTGQLILPESLKLLPVYTAATMRSEFFADVPSGFAIDAHVCAAFALRRVSVETLLLTLYPRLFALHEMSPSVAVPDQYGYCSTLPPPVALRKEEVRPDAGVYLVDNGTFIYLFVAPAAAQFAAQFADTAAARLLPPSTGELCARIHAIVRTLSLTDASNFKPVRVVALQSSPAADRLFYSLLVEERHQHAPSYVDFLCNVHRAIQDNL
jgi:protein transport protein SEC24